MRLLNTQIIIMCEADLQKIGYIIDVHCRSVPTGLTSRSVGSWAVEGGAIKARYATLSLCRYGCV